jgi:hypothetical protein
MTVPEAHQSLPLVFAKWRRDSVLLLAFTYKTGMAFSLFRSAPRKEEISFFPVVFH